MRVCSYTYVTEGVPDAHHSYDGSPLLRCSRCKLIFYKDKAAQKAHYSFHRHSCKLIASSPSSFPFDDDAIATKYSDLEACFSTLKDELSNSPNLAAILVKIRQLMDEDPGEAFNMGMPLHSWARGLIFYPNNIMAAVMGRPCMAKLMLCSADDISDNESATERKFREDLLSEKARILKQLSKYHGRPSNEFIRNRIVNPEEKERVEKLCKQHDELDDEDGDPSSMSYCYLYFNLLVAAVVRAPSSDYSFHDGRGTIRGSVFSGPDSEAEYLLATASLRRAMSLWSDPHVLDSCGDAMAPAAALAITAIRHYIARRKLGDVGCRDDEIIPGLTADAAVKACLLEIRRKAISSRYSAELIEFLAELALKPRSFWGLVERTSLWDGLPVGRRASCALAIVRYIAKVDEGDDGDSYGPDLGHLIDSPPFTECNILFHTVSAMTEEDPGDLAKAVLDMASGQGDYLGPVSAGRNPEGIAFFYYLSRAGKFDVKDVVGEYEKFDAIPRLLHAKENDLAKEKDECLKLAGV